METTTNRKYVVFDVTTNNLIYGKFDTLTAAWDYIVLRPNKFLKVMALQDGLAVDLNKLEEIMLERYIADKLPVKKWVRPVQQQIADMIKEYDDILGKRNKRNRIYRKLIEECHIKYHKDKYKYFKEILVQ